MNQQLLMALMQGAPALLNALKSTTMRPGTTENLVDAARNGADLGLMDEQFTDLVSSNAGTVAGWHPDNANAYNVAMLNRLYDTTPQDFPSFRATAGDVLTDLVSNADTSRLSAQDRQNLEVLYNDSDMQDTLESTAMHRVLNQMESVVDAPGVSNYKIPDTVPAGFSADIPNQLGKRKTKYPAAVSANSMLDALAQQRYKNDPSWGALLGPQPYLK